MRKIIGYLFPWRPTFRRLNLEKLWWHRLAVVLFFVSLIPVFVYSWALGDDANAPANPFEQDIHHWGAFSGASSGVLLDLDSIQNIDSSAPPPPRPPTVQKTIEMPNGKIATFPGTISDEAIKIEWQHKFNVMQSQAICLGLGIAVLVVVGFSYLFQTVYRAFLYVIYGAKARAIPDNFLADETDQ